MKAKTGNACQIKNVIVAGSCLTYPYTFVLLNSSKTEEGHTCFELYVLYTVTTSLYDIISCHFVCTGPTVDPLYFIFLFVHVVWFSQNTCGLNYPFHEPTEG